MMEHKKSIHECQETKTVKLNDSSNERSPFLVRKCNTATAYARKEPIRALGNPHEGEDGEREGTPVDECRLGLMSKNSPERPGDCNRCGKVTLRGGKCISGGRTLKEKARQVRAGFARDQKTYRARKTKTLVQTPSRCSNEFIPKASKALRTTRTVVHPW